MIIANGSNRMMENQNMREISSRRTYVYLAWGCVVMAAPFSGYVALLGAGAEVFPTGCGWFDGYVVPG